ncbi:hypothetical protein CN918_32585 [Priestia megaterium]|nr:hypothetical protein CN918_32585 [Priestia megaterium]
MSNIYIFGGPSGVGKSVLAKRVFTPEQKLTTNTSRIIRFGEIPGIDYYFVPTERFIEMIENDEFIEYAPFANGFYGLTKTEYESKIRKDDVYIILTEQGIKTYKEKFSNCIVLYIDVDKEDALKNLRDRGESESVIEERMCRYDEEAKSKEMADYVIVNRRGFFEETVQTLKNIVINNRTDADY